MIGSDSLGNNFFFWNAIHYAIKLHIRVKLGFKPRNLEGLFFFFVCVYVKLHVVGKQ